MGVGVDALAATGPPMVMIQDLDWGTSGLPVDVIADTFERVPAFRCLKVEVVPAGPKYTAVLEATRGRLHVSGGWAADQMIEALDRGVDVARVSFVVDPQPVRMLVRRADIAKFSRANFMTSDPHRHIDRGVLELAQRPLEGRALGRTGGIGEHRLVDGKGIGEGASVHRLRVYRGALGASV